MNQITHDGLVERISKAMMEMTGEELAALYNQNFGSGITYLGDSQYKQESEEEINAKADAESAEFLSQFTDANPMPTTCQDIADVMSDRLDDNGVPAGPTADCDDIRKDYLLEFGSDALLRAYDKADADDKIN